MVCGQPIRNLLIIYDKGLLVPTWIKSPIGTNGKLAGSCPPLGVVVHHLVNNCIDINVDDGELDEKR